VQTEDGGKTWTQQLYNDRDGYYLNGVHCASEAVCATVGEGFGDDPDKDGNHVLVTGARRRMMHRMGAGRGVSRGGGVCGAAVDGGKTWTDQHFWHTNGSSLVQVRPIGHDSLGGPIPEAPLPSCLRPLFRMMLHTSQHDDLPLAS
jgi:hypothetical protein